MKSRDFEKHVGGFFYLISWVLKFNFIGTIRYGFGEFEAVKEDSSLAWYYQLQKGLEFPEELKVFERIFKIIAAIEKRNHASAKLAMHSMSFGGASQP